MQKLLWSSLKWFYVSVNDRSEITEVEIFSSFCLCYGQYFCQLIFSRRLDNDSLMMAKMVASREEARKNILALLGDLRYDSGEIFVIGHLRSRENAFPIVKVALTILRSIIC